MALIRCPECKKQISETAESCSRCGYKVTPEEVAEIKKKKQVWKLGCAILFLAFFILTFISMTQDCSSLYKAAKQTNTSTYQTTIRIHVDIDTLVNRSASYVDSVLGKPSQVTPMKPYFDGESRYYSFSEGSATIEFHKGKAKLFQVEVDTTESSPQQLARRCGFDTGEIGGIKTTKMAKIWTRVQSENAHYKRVMAVKDIYSGEYSVFQAEVY